MKLFKILTALLLAQGLYLCHATEDMPIEIKTKARKIVVSVKDKLCKIVSDEKEHTIDAPEAVQCEFVLAEEVQDGVYDLDDMPDCSVNFIKFGFGNKFCFVSNIVNLISPAEGEFIPRDEELIDKIMSLNDGLYAFCHPGYESSKIKGDILDKLNDTLKSLVQSNTLASTEASQTVSDDFS